MQVDSTAPSAGDGKMTEHDRATNNYRVTWKVWDALSVPDWCFGKDGKLDWIIVASEVYDNSDINSEPVTYTLRTLFQRMNGKVFISEYCDKPEKVTRSGFELKGCSEIPFVLVGTPSVDGWWFDDVEAIQALCLNLGSLHQESLSKTVYPQLVLALSMLDNIETKIVETDSKKQNGVKETLLEIVKSLEQPLWESPEDKSISRFLQPNASDMKPIPEELERMRRLVFDMAGMGLFNKETRQIQTAESKKFDHLDTASTLQNRSVLMQEAEKKMVALSVLFDKAFKVYEPVWPIDFDVTDSKEVMAALSMAMNMPYVTPAMRKIYAMAMLSEVTKIYKASPKLVGDANKEIEAMGEAST